MEITYPCKAQRPVAKVAVEVYEQDLAVLEAYARSRRWSLQGTVNFCALVLLHGGSVLGLPPQLAPNEWRRIPD